MEILKSLEDYISTSVMLQYNFVFIDMVTIIIILCLVDYNEYLIIIGRIWRIIDTIGRIIAEN